MRAYETKGHEALTARQASRPKSKLTEEQRQQVKRWLVGQDPRKYGFEFGLRTCRIFSELIAEKFDLTLKLTAAGRLLASLEITPQKPLRRACGRNPKAIKQWLARDCPRLKRRARQHEATIFLAIPLFQPLDEQPQPSAIPIQDHQPAVPPVGENKERAVPSSPRRSLTKPYSPLKLLRKSTDFAPRTPQTSAKAQHRARARWAIKATKSAAI